MAEEGGSGRTIFGGKRGLFEDLRDTNEDGRVGFGDTWLGDLLGFDGQAGVQGASYAESRSGARRRAAQSTTRPVARPARETQAELDAAERDFLAPYQQYGASRAAAAALQAETEDAPAENNANTTSPINPRLASQEQRLDEQTVSALGVPRVTSAAEQIVELPSLPPAPQYQAPTPITDGREMVTHEQFDAMSRSEREAKGLPLTTFGWQNAQAVPGLVQRPAPVMPQPAQRVDTPFQAPVEPVGFMTGPIPQMDEQQPTSTASVLSGATVPPQQGTQYTETRPDIVMRNPPATAGTQDGAPIEVRVQVPDGRFIDDRLLAQEQALERSPRPLAATTTPTGSSAPAGSSRPLVPAPESASMDVGMYNRFANRPSELTAAQDADPAIADSRTGLDSSFDSFPFNAGEPVPMDNIRQQAGRMQRQGNSATNGLMAPAVDGADLPRDMSRVNTPSGMPAPVGQDSMPNVDTTFRYERTRYTDRLEAMLSDLRIPEIGGRSSMEFFLTPMTPDKFTQLMSIIGPMDPQISLRLMDTYPELKDALEIGMAMVQGTN